MPCGLLLSLHNYNIMDNSKKFLKIEKQYSVTNKYNDSKDTCNITMKKTVGGYLHVSICQYQMI